MPGSAWSAFPVSDVRSILFPLTILMALAATGGLALLAFRELGPAEFPPADPDRPGAPAAKRASDKPGEPKTLRAYQTTATLAEDLRDALAGEQKELFKEWSRVSTALEPKARWTLVNLARKEASPRVRALIVLAAGVHVPDEDLLLDFLDDDRSVVRQAAALASGYLAGARHKRELMAGLKIPVGRAPGIGAERRLRSRHGLEKDPDVKEAIDAVLEAGSLSSRR